MKAKKQIKMQMYLTLIIYFFLPTILLSIQLIDFLGWIVMLPLFYYGYWKGCDWIGEKKIT